MQKNKTPEKVSVANPNPTADTLNVVERGHLTKILDKVKYNPDTDSFTDETHEITLGDFDPLCLLSNRVLYVQDGETKFRNRFTEGQDNPTIGGVKGEKREVSALWFVSYCVTKAAINAQRKVEDEDGNVVTVPVREFPSAIVTASRRLATESGNPEVDDWRELVTEVLLRELKAGNRETALDKARSALYDDFDKNRRLDTYKTLPKEEVLDLDFKASNEQLRCSVLGDDWAERLTDEVSKRKGCASFATPTEEIEQLRCSGEFSSDFSEELTAFFHEVKENKGKFWGLSRWYTIFANSENIPNCEIAKQLDLSQAAVSKNISESQLAFYSYAVEKNPKFVKPMVLSYAKKHLPSLMGWLIGETDKCPKGFEPFVLSRRERKIVKGKNGEKKTTLVAVLDEVKEKTLKGWILDEVKSQLESGNPTDWTEMIKSFNHEVIKKLVKVIATRK